MEFLLLLEESEIPEANKQVELPIHLRAAYQMLTFAHMSGVQSHAIETPPIYCWASQSG